MNDARNFPIEVGDIVAYPGRKGSSCWLTPAIVTKIRDTSDRRGIQVHPINPLNDTPLATARPRWVWGLDNVVRLFRPQPTERIN